MTEKEAIISIHAPTRGATCFAAAIAFSRSYFNPRSYKRSDSARCKCENRSNNFNPRSYKRSDWLEGEKLTQLGISIHAPTRGATIITAERCLPEPISIHAPTRGATLKAWTEMQKQ